MKCPNHSNRRVTRRHTLPALLVILLAPSPSASQDQGPGYNHGAALARACMGESGDISLISENLRKDGWQELSSPVAEPKDRKVTGELSPEVLRVLMNASMLFLLDGDLKSALFESRRDMSHADSKIFNWPFSFSRGEVFFKPDVGLFSISVSDRGGPLTDVDCNFSGPWNLEDDRMRWLLPGKQISAARGYMKRIYGTDAQAGPYKGGFMRMEPGGLEALFEAEYPRLTFFDISVFVPDDD